MASSVSRVDFKGVASAVKPTELQLLEKIVNVYGQLSPENLTCDGELPRTEVNRRRKALEKELIDLFLMYGADLEEGEAYDMYERKKKEAGL